MSALSTCLNALCSRQLCQLCVFPPLNEALLVYRCVSLLKQGAELGFGTALSFSAALPVGAAAWSVSGSACSVG